MLDKDEIQGNDEFEKNDELEPEMLEDNSEVNTDIEENDINEEKNVLTKQIILKEILDWVIHISLAIIIGILIVKFVAQITIVSGNSMETTLQNGDRLIVEKLSVKFGSIKEGDIVTINHPQDFPNERSPIIKRVIGIENDVIEFKNGKVFVNDKQLEEHYINGDLTNESNNMDYNKITVKKGQIFVLGDNRLPGKSLDSRIFGPIDIEKVGGKAVLRIMPFAKAGKIGGEK